MSDLPTLSVVLPMWNEEALIVRTVTAVDETGRRLQQTGCIASHEIVVVDDGSTDQTGDLADSIASSNPCVVALHHPRNRSMGRAVRTGLEHATGDVVLVTGADLPFDLAETERALRLMAVHDADIVAPYRFDRTGEGPRRWVYSYAYNALVRALLGLRVRDVNFAAKLIRREVLDQVDLHSEGSFIDVELLAKATRRGFRVIQFGVDYFPRSRGVSTLSSWGVIARMLWEMATIHGEIRSSGPRRP